MAIGVPISMPNLQAPLSETELNYIDLQAQISTLFKNKWLIVGLSLLSCILTLGYTLVKPANYQASVLMQIHHQEESSLGAIHSSLSNPSNQTYEPIGVQIALIKSKFVLSPAIEALNE